MSQASISAEAGVISIRGALDFQSVAEIMDGVEGLLTSESVIIDMAAVGQCNSAALALMLECLKIAQQKHLKIKYHNLPEQLRVIARAYGIEQFLPTE